MDPTVARAAAVAAEQRDRDMVLQLGGLVFQGAEAAAGATRVRPWRRELAALARLLYYAVTAGRGMPTPGQEYAGSRLRDSQGYEPSVKRRLLYAVVTGLTPYLGARLVDYLGRRIAAIAAAASSNYASTSRSRKPQETSRWMALLTAWPAISRAVARLPAVHLVGFLLLDGVFVTISQRLLRLTPHHPPADGRRARPNDLRLLAGLLTAQLSVEVLAWFYDQYVEHRRQRDSGLLATIPVVGEADLDEGSDAAVEDHTAKRCVLCLGPRRDASATECGHIFCWSCIQGWLADADGCPVCRRPAKPQGVVRLWNWQ